MKPLLIVAFSLVLFLPACVDELAAEDPVGPTPPAVFATEAPASGAEPPPLDPDPATPPGDIPTDVGNCGDACGYGELRGRVCAPSEQVFVNGATVWLDVLDCDGAVVHLETESQPDGSYHFPQVPCGEHTLNVAKGSFHRDYPVYVQAGHLTDITGAANKLCFHASTTPIAVLDGNWDDIEGILDTLGLEYDLYTFGLPEQEGSIRNLLSNPLKLASYDIVFANCGQEHAHIPTGHPELLDNVRDYVLAGGSFYSSDYTWFYGESAFPSAIEFLGVDDDTTSNEGPKAIHGGQVFPADVVDPELAAYLGKDVIDIHFDIGPQVAPEAAGAETVVHVEADIHQPIGSKPVTGVRPVVLSYTPAPGAGRVVYTNFHNDAQATDDVAKLLSYLVFTL